MFGLVCGNVQAAEITNFMSGPVCNLEDEDNWSICAQAEDVYVKGGSECDWSGQSVRCSWFGYQFDYADLDPGMPLDCYYERSEPSDEGNYEGVREQDKSTGNFELEVEGIEGHHFHPMYQVYAPAASSGAPMILTCIRCSIDGRQVFDMTYRLHMGADLLEQ